MLKVLLSVQVHAQAAGQLAATEAALAANKDVHRILQARLTSWKAQQAHKEQAQSASMGNPANWILQNAANCTHLSSISDRCTIMQIQAEHMLYRCQNLSGKGSLHLHLRALKT